METTPKSRPWFAILPVVIMLIMIVLPTSRRLIAAQIKLVFKAPHAYAWALRSQGISANDLPDCDPGEEQAALQGLASAHPQDYQIQLAYSLMAEWSHAENTPDDRVRRLDALAGVFPLRATVYAHMLRYETEREVKIRRQAEFEHIVNQTPKDDIRMDADELHPPADLSKRLDEYERYAIAGENLEPDNAYFTMMRAVGLLANHNDRLAVECIKSAAAKHQWDDHLADELEADWKLGSMAFNDNSAALRSTIQGGVTSPHLVQLAALGRTATTLAIELETDGRGAEGAELRAAMARCGGIMRRSARTIPAAITGADIVYQQIFRPGAAPPIVEDVNFSTAQRAQQRLDAYYNYLRKYGHDREADWMQHELAADAQVKDIQRGAALASLSPYGRHGLRVTSWWMLDCVLLTNIVYLLVAVALMLPFTLRRKVQPSSVALVLTGAVSLGVAIAWISQWAVAMTSIRGAFKHWIERNGDVTGSRLNTMTDKVFDPGSIHLVVVALAMIAPILLLALLYRHSRKSNIVFIDTIKLDLVQVGAVLACAIMVFYGFALTRTAIHEVKLHSELDQVIVSEGKYDAPLIGKQWPD